MRLILTKVGLAVLSVLCLGLEARAGTYLFQTDSTATQMIDFGGTIFPLTAYGIQTFTINTDTGYANVTSPFKGTDLPDPYIPGQFDSYNLYNTATTGTVTTNPGGTFTIAFELYFELDVTSGSLKGLSLVTTQLANFTASNVPTLPFPAGTAFSDPSGSDMVYISVKNDFGPFKAGEIVGTSYGRTVTVDAVVPEPSGIILLGIGVVGMCGYARKFRVKS